MGDLDRLGKDILKAACGSLFTEAGPSVCFSFGPGAGSCRIDGTVAGLVAVEIESRTPKQVRGALIDLVLHPYPKKLLLILPAYSGNAITAKTQAEAILGQFLARSAFRVVCVDEKNIEQPIVAIRSALQELGVKLAPE